ncbi:hypothetical protein Zmor_020193 [Zophobas morio]|uniref:Uncharacterized protein n=1 Tax=Zophobas morio TaxID=2755281 RepID=A0AA38I2F7_9CUCU|nr:hypothetical protein Zmor_020193 [Zophobas morio]
MFDALPQKSTLTTETVAESPWGSSDKPNSPSFTARMMQLRCNTRISVHSQPLTCRKRPRALPLAAASGGGRCGGGIRGSPPTGKQENRRQTVASVKCSSNYPLQTRMGLI